jgi:glycosyltransferase involved in cell wall biosynthesis
MDSLQEELSFLRNEVEWLKSSLDVPPELVDQFMDWKAHNPIPKEPLVTVTVATYNRARLLTEKCIPSILSQTYKKLQLIVVGDGCTDETEKLVRSIKDPRLKFHNLTERGSYPSDNERRWMVAGVTAANKAFEMVDGDYLTHLDDDDEYVPERVEKLLDFALANQCDLVWHPFWWEQPDGNWIMNEAVGFAPEQVTNGSVFYRSWLRKIEFDVNSHRLKEPADWNRFRRMKYLGLVSMRYPEPLLKHYRERSRPDTKRER